MDLKLQPFFRDEKILGYELITPHCHYFFGTAHLPKESLPALFPNYEFRHLKQVHGSRVIKSESGVLEADAHWTNESGIALAIQTADCLPVLFGSEHGALAAHAGWRGVENEILVRSSEIWNNMDTSNTKIIIGPHIRAESFEVGEDVAQRLFNTFLKMKTNESTPLKVHPDPQKCWVDLAQIATAQIKGTLKQSSMPLISEQNTFTDANFHSFRRGKAPQGRQFSFVARL